MPAAAVVDTFVLKIVVTPLLIAAASLAGRRWGQSVSGWLVGLPLTSGPVAFFLAVDHGAGFAEAAAVGSLLGAIAEVAFCLAYAHVASRASWPIALTAACGAFVVTALLLQWAPAAPLLLGAAGFAALAAARLVMPPGVEGSSTVRLPRWDIPARMVITTVLVVLLTKAALVLGPRVSGVLATFPLYAAIMTLFAHRLQGTGPAIGVLRGLLLGLFAFCGFFVVLGLSIAQVGTGLAFALATVAALVIQGGSLGVMLARRARV